MFVVYQDIYKTSERKAFKSQNFVDFLLRLEATIVSTKVVSISSTSKLSE